MNHVPKRIFVMDSIPRSGAGKVVRPEFKNVARGEALNLIRITEL